jgi:predicted TPR repeat methyltransferase
MELMTVPADVHDAFDFVEEQFNEALDQSLDPAGPGVLYDYVAAMGLAAGAVALDAGCGDGMLALAAVRAQLDPRSLDRDDLVRHHCCV